MRHHVILGEALSTEALGKGGHRTSLLGPAHWLVFYNHSGQVGTGRGAGKGDPAPGTPPRAPLSFGVPPLGHLQHVVQGWPPQPMGLRQVWGASLACSP